MRCRCDEVTGGLRITLLLMIIKRTICAKTLGCLLFSPHMEWMFYLLLFWISLNVFSIEAMQLKCTVNIVLHFYASISYRQKAALIKGIQWCTIWVTKYATKHNIRHILATRCCKRKYIPYGIILKNAKKTQNANIRFKGYAGFGLYWCDFNVLLTKGYSSSELLVQLYSSYVRAIERNLSCRSMITFLIFIWRGFNASLKKLCILQLAIRLMEKVILTALEKVLNWKQTTKQYMQLQTIG